MIRNRSLKKTLAVLILPALFLLLHNRVANWHYHVFNGMVIEHAHPYQNAPRSATPFQNHQHTDAELLILAGLSHALPLLMAGVVLAGLLIFPSAGVARLPQAVFFTRQSLPARPLRAPPVISA
jgi:hypothetical protein